MSLYIIHTVCTASQSLSTACQRKYLEPNHNLRFKVWTRWKEQKMHYDVQKSVRRWERSSILTSAVLCFPCSQGTVHLGIPSYKGCSWWSRSAARELWLCTAELCDTSTETLCPRNSEATTMHLVLPAQTHSSPGCAMKSMKLFHWAFWFGWDNPLYTWRYREFPDQLWNA